MEILDVDNSYKLWEKDQSVVTLGLIKEGKSTTFVGDKRGTINASVSLIKTRKQWTDYTDEVLSLVSINREKNGGSISTFDHTSYPFCIVDVPLPECNTDFYIC